MRFYAFLQKIYHEKVNTPIHSCPIKLFLNGRFWSPVNIGDRVLLKNAWPTKFNQDAFLDPYVITAVRNNGTIHLRTRITFAT